MQNLAQRDFHGAARAMQAHIFNRMLPAIYGGKLLDNAMYCVIRHQLTPVLMRYSLTRVFSSVEHGPSFETMYKACSDATPYILVVKTSSGVFGALKWALVASVLLNVFDTFDRRFAWVEPQVKRESLLYDGMLHFGPRLWEETKDLLPAPQEGKGAEQANSDTLHT